MNLRILLVAASALTLAACSTSHVDHPTLNAPPSVPVTGTAAAPSQGTTGLPTPCSLLTATQVHTAFGGTVANGSTPASSTRQECQWVVTGSKFGTDGTVIVYYPPVQSSAAYQAARAGLPGATTIPELGDGAFYASATTSLTVLAGEHQFVVQGDFGRAADAGDLQVALIAVAQLAETHL